MDYDPYFVPDEAVFSALRLAVLRGGVDVRILIPSRPDHKIVYAASSLYAFEAVRAGVRIFQGVINRGFCIKKWCWSTTKSAPLAAPIWTTDRSVSTLK